MRLGEAFSITAADIDYRRNVLSIPLPDTSKKKHRREIPFLPELLPPALSGKLFRISQPAAQTYFKRLFKTLGVNAVPHSFRHTFISVCNSVGVPIKQIQFWAGHRSITTTMNVYAHILDHKETPISDYLKRLKNTLGL
jgi:integrase